MTAGASVRPVGGPALKPYFTERDVRAYIAQHGFPLAATLTGGPAQISRVQFVTSAEAIFQEPTGAAPNDMVCIVWFAGPLQSGSPSYANPHQPTPAPVPPKPAIASGGNMVFDMTTGNLLEFGLN